MRKKTTILLSLIMVILTGCTTPRQMTLFCGDSTGEQVPIPDYIIEPGDVLYILFSSVNGDAAKPYNSAGTSHLVKKDGTIEIPLIGTIMVAGKTEKELVGWLLDLARLQVQDPIVHVHVSNAVVSFLGEVRTPSNVPAIHPITFAEALGSVGGFTKNAKCNDVVIRRYVNGKLQVYHINLLTDEIFHSPCYYLMKGDVVYVAPLHAKRS